MRTAALVLSLALVTCSGSDGGPYDPANPNQPGSPSNPNDPGNPGDPLGTLTAPIKNGSRLRNKYIEATDGTVTLQIGLYDTQRNEDCSFVDAEDGQLRCLPLTGPSYVATVFVDSSCTIPLVFGPNCSAPAKTTYELITTAGCSRWRVRSISEIAMPANIYTKSGTMCTPTPNPYAGYRFYQAGNSIAPTEFVAGTRKY